MVTGDSKDASKAVAEKVGIINKKKIVENAPAL